MSIRHLTPVVCVAMLIVACGQQGRAMTIDVFTATQGPADDTTVGGGGAQSSMPGPQAGNIVPATGSRELFAEKTSGAIGRARLQVDFDVLFYSSNSGIGGRFEVAYLNLDGVDLSFGDGFTIEGEIDTSAAVKGGTTLGLYVEDMSSNAARSDVSLTTSGAFSHTFLKSDFAGVDFGEVEAIRLGTFDAATGDFVDVPAGGDVIITAVELTVVPEPRDYLPAALVAAFALVCIVRRSTLRMSRARP